MDVFQEAFVQGLQVFQFLYQGSPLPGEVDELLHLLRADAVLHEFGDGAFHLVDVALSVEEAAQGGQVSFQVRGHLLEHQAFAGVVQHGDFLAAYFLQDAVAQASEA